MSEETFRKDERVPVQLDCRIQTAEETLSGQISDLGMGGLSAVIPQELEAQSRVTLDLSLDRDRPSLSIEATVQWCRETESGYTVGLAFDNPPGEVLVDLAQWLARVPRTTEVF